MYTVWTSITCDSKTQNCIFRIQSGHTFHLGYLLGLINGIIVFGITLWQQIMH